MSGPAADGAAMVAATTNITNMEDIDMTVRCKFQLQEVHDLMWGKKYFFRPQYDDTIPEDRRFAKYSPSGEFWIMVDNPAVEYKIGHFYYFDSHEVPEPVKDTSHE
jgi:hypothetical protein